MTQRTESFRIVRCGVAVTVAMLARAPATAQPLATGNAVAQTGASTVLRLDEAIRRGLEYNLAATGLSSAVDRAQAETRIARSALRPDVSAEFSALEQRLNLAAMGVRIQVPGVAISDVTDPFNVVDLRARFSQPIWNRNLSDRYRATQEAVRASELSLEDARDTIVLSVGTAYLDVLAGQARVIATAAQVATATSIQQRASQQRDAGLATPLDVNRAQVQTLNARQRLTTLQADLAKKRITLARLIGAPLSDEFELAARDVPFAAAPAITLDAGLRQLADRPDVKAAEAQVRMAELSLAAARAGNLPTVVLSGDAGTNRASESSAHGTFTLAGVVRVPLWTGGRTAAQVQEATTALAQRRIDLDDVKARIESDLRKAFVDVAAAASQVDVAQSSLALARETLALTRQRFDAGVTDNVSVVQSQESLAAAEFDHINSILAHNIAKLTVGRAIGRLSEDLAQYLQLP